MKSKTIIINLKSAEWPVALKILKTFEGFSDQEHEIMFSINPCHFTEIIRNDIKLSIILNDIPLDTTYLENLQEQNKLCIKGILLNHPEKKINVKEIQHKVKKIKSLDLKVILGISSVSEAKEFCYAYNPDFLFYEFVELIGKKISIKDHAGAEIIEQIKSNINSKLLIGGGIKEYNDFEVVNNYKGDGVLISSMIINSSEPLNAMISFLKKNNKIEGEFAEWKK